jgi:LL-diaminopimelate aminotransferase
MTPTTMQTPSMPQPVPPISVTTREQSASIRSDRLRALPPFLFSEIDRQKRAKRAAGRDVIDLGVGDPDRPTPPFIIEALAEAARKPANHRYPDGPGTMSFREAAARFMQRRFGVTVDPTRHILACIGSKDGIAHLPLAVVNPGDVICAPTPAYPVYKTCGLFAGAHMHEMPLNEANGWKPDFSQVPPEIARRTKLVWVNYPSNPTAASADLELYQRLIAFCQSAQGGAGAIAASDVAYSELYFEHKPVSMWQAADINKTLGIEFHSLSKTFNMTGWRIAFAVGHPEVVGALAAMKDNVDSGAFNAIQDAGAVALDHFDHPDVETMRQLYRERRDAVIPALRTLGCRVESPQAGFFVWARCPEAGGHSGQPMDSMEFASRCLEEADVVVVPGAGFGEAGRHYFRIALTVETPRIVEAMQRLARVNWSS